MKRRKLIVISLMSSIVLILTIASIVVFAVYTKSSRTKRVISSTKDNGMLFSSNYLSPTVENAYNKKTITTPADDVSASINLTVCNYAQENRGEYHETNITYTLSFKLMYKTSETTFRDAVQGDLTSESVTVKLVGTNTTYTLNSSNLSVTPSSGDFYERVLTGGISSTDTYTITFSTDFNDEDSRICLFLIATPVGNYQDIKSMDVVLHVKVRSEEAKTSWTGALNETKAPSYLDGFNYVVSGNGSGTIILSWDPTKLTINQFFVLDMIPSSGTIKSGSVDDSEEKVNDDWLYVRFDVDSSEVSRYEIQFFRINSSVEFETLDDVLDAINFDFNSAS
ncbi:hypothetical protein IKQ02_05040 [bacterium]|nr:hypothetical protein [bacterium]